MVFPELRRGMFASKINRSHAYFHCPLSPHFSNYVRVEVGEECFSFPVLPFGLHVSPQVRQSMINVPLPIWRSMALDIFRQWGLSAEQSAEVGRWAYLTALTSHYSTLVANDFLAEALQTCLSSVRSLSSSWCSGPSPSRSPSSKREEGGREEEGTEHQEVEPSPPDPRACSWFGRSSASGCKC